MRLQISGMTMVAYLALGLVHAQDGRGTNDSLALKGSRFGAVAAEAARAKTRAPVAATQHAEVGFETSDLPAIKDLRLGIAAADAALAKKRAPAEAEIARCRSELAENPQSPQSPTRLLHAEVGIAVALAAHAEALATVFENAINTIRAKKADVIDGIDERAGASPEALRGIRGVLMDQRADAIAQGDTRFASELEEHIKSSEDALHDAEAAIARGVAADESMRAVLDSLAVKAAQRRRLAQIHHSTARIKAVIALALHKSVQQEAYATGVQRVITEVK